MEPTRMGDLACSYNKGEGDILTGETVANGDERKEEEESTAKFNSAAERTTYEDIINYGSTDDDD